MRSDSCTHIPDVDLKTCVVRQLDQRSAGIYRQCSRTCKAHLDLVANRRSTPYMDCAGAAPFVKSFACMFQPSFPSRPRFTRSMMERTILHTDDSISMSSFNRRVGCCSQNVEPAAAFASEDGKGHEALPTCRTDYRVFCKALVPNQHRSQVVYARYFLAKGSLSSALLPYANRQSAMFLAMMRSKMPIASFSLDCEGVSLTCASETGHGAEHCSGHHAIEILRRTPRAEQHRVTVPVQASQHS